MNVDRFQQVAALITSRLLSKHPKPTDQEVKRVVAAMRADASLDYDQLATPFAATYWERNFWKAAYFFGYECKKPEILASRLFLNDSAMDVVVLGAGSAADTIACLVWLDANYPLQKVRVTLVDRSGQQLELARELINLALSILQQAQIQVRYVQANARTWRPARNSADMALMSHFLTENPGSLNVLVGKTLDMLRPRGEAVIIERRRDAVWQQVRDSLGLQGVTTHDLALSGDKFAQLAAVMPAKEHDMSPCYVRGYMPESEALRQLVAGYFLAWVEQSAARLPDVFTSDAVYDEKPGEELPIQGIAGIQQYWEAHPGQQRNLDLRVHGVAYSPTVVVCSFGGDFDTPKQHIKIEGAINFYVDPHRGRFHCLREYFRTQKTPFAQSV